MAMQLGMVTLRASSGSPVFMLESAEHGDRGPGTRCAIQRHSGAISWVDRDGNAQNRREADGTGRGRKAATTLGKQRAFVH